jgi:choline dehydrogenase-like flavoprotein
MAQQRPEYDVCIVGSGAGGGMAAHVLTQAGANVVMLEAGPEWYASKNATMMVPAYASPRRGAATRIRPFGDFDACDGGFNIEGEPYTRADGTSFNWWRARMLGGRTNHWGRISLRFGPDDFKPFSKDGLGLDWPITYDDVKPYYDRVDRLVGIFGSVEGLRNGNAPANHFPGQCSNCHNTSDWSQVNFSHAGFTDCVSCHSGNAPANHFPGQCSNCHNTGSWNDVDFNHNGFTDCQSCHTPPGGHFPGQCSNCHETGDWDNVNFSHQGLTNCNSCHSPPNDDEHEGNVPQCSQCHNTEDWDDADDLTNELLLENILNA